MSGKTRAEARRQAREKQRPEPPQLAPIVVPDIVPDDLREDANWALSFKAFAVADNLLGCGDIPPMISLYRDGDLLLRAICSQVDRDEGLQFLSIAVPGFAADEATFFADTHVTDNRFVDEKGRMPDPHELQHLCDNEGACDLGLTTDSIFMMRSTSEESTARYVHFPYHVNKQAKQVHWQDEVVLMDERDPKVNMSGLIANTIRGIMASERSELPPELGEPTTARFLADMHLVAALTMAGYAVLWATRDEEEHALVNDTLLNLGVSGDGQTPTREPSPTMQYLAAKMRLRIRDFSKERHTQELADAARRRAERGEPPAPWTKPG